jgi:glycosyltransferase involved in cell wall biosynthesis
MPAAGEIIVNTRCLTASLSGVQRYLNELLRCLGSRLTGVSPTRPSQGLRGHIWEQAVLPSIVGAGLLWSPANSGPMLLERQVVTVHDVACLDHPEWFNGRFAAWYRRMLPALVRRARAIITVSEFTRHRLAALTGVSGSKVSVVPNGVSGRFRPRLEPEIVQVLSELAIPTRHYILSLGTREPRKNIMRQLEAWSGCVPDLPDDVWLVIAGTSGARQVFGQVRLDSLPTRVHLAGFVADDSLPALYSGALALLYPSIYEGFGLPALEAMASGSAAIVSDCGALPDLAGDAALLVDPNDSKSIAQGIRTMVNNRELRLELGARALRRARLYSWQRAADMTWGVLEQASSMTVARRSQAGGSPVP